MGSSLLWRLLGAQVLVIALAVTLSGALITDLASQSFGAIMARYHIEPVAVEAELLAAIHRVLLGSSLVAAAAAMLLGWLLVRRTVRPLEEMMVLAECIARGDYACRVDLRGPAEIVRLADSLNRMAASLQRIEALRRELVANVAHELRTPLSTVQGYLEAMREGVVPVTPESLASLEEEALRLVRLVDALHQLSQFDARASRIRAADVDLRDLAERTVRAAAPAFARRGMRVQVAADPRVRGVRADPDLVAQALGNLLDNALRYAPQGADVLVEVTPDGDTVRLAVRNTGEGILPDDLPHIFERFYRGEKSRSHTTGGTGIGLAIVSEIARAHGGRVGALCRDGATTVWFSLGARGPVSPSPVAPAVQETGAARA